MRRTVNRRGMMVSTNPRQDPKMPTNGAYMPDVRPFMRRYGYNENLEDILREIDRLPRGNHFYYEQGDLWRRNP